MKHFVLYLTVFWLSILKVLCQYGPYVGAVGQFSVECMQTETEVIQSPGSENYEVIAGKPFAYKCEFVVDTRKCENQEFSSGCKGIEIVWTLPSNLAQIQREKGITRKTEKVIVESRDGFDKYINWFNISDVGSIHEGQYNWNFNLKFEMKTAIEGSLRIRVIDMIENNESCKYDDSCQSNKCHDNYCVGDNQSKFPWMIVGLSIGGLIILALIIVSAVLLFLLRKEKSNNRRDNS